MASENQKHKSLKPYCHYTITVELPVLIISTGDGRFIAEVPAMPGCSTEGSMDQINSNLPDVLADYIAAKYDPGRRLYGCRAGR